MTLGMIQLVVIGFPGNDFKGEIVPELDAIREKGLARILDLAFIYKDDAGTMTSVHFSDLTEEEKIRFDAAAGALVGLGTGGISDVPAGMEAGAQVAAEGALAITDEDVEEIANEVPAGSSALIILFEHLWSLPFKQAIINANGQLVGNWIIQPELLSELGAEVDVEQEASQPV